MSAAPAPHSLDRRPERIPLEGYAFGLMLSQGAAVAIITAGLVLAFAARAPLNGTQWAGALIVAAGGALMLRVRYVAQRRAAALSLAGDPPP